MKHIGVLPECNSSLKSEKCATRFSRKSDLKRNKKSTIGVSVKVTCDISGKEVCNGKVLKAHITSEHEDSVYKLKCHLLPKEDSDDLQEMEERKFYKCEQCSRVY